MGPGGPFPPQGPGGPGSGGPGGPGPGGPSGPGGPGPGGPSTPDPAAWREGRAWPADVDLDLDDGERSPRGKRALVITLVVVLVVGVAGAAAFFTRGLWSGSTTPAADTGDKTPKNLPPKKKKAKPSPTTTGAPQLAKNTPPPPTKAERPLVKVPLRQSKATALKSDLDGPVTFAAYKINDIVHVWNPYKKTFDKTDFASEPRPSPEGSWMAALTSQDGDFVIMDRQSGEKRTIKRPDFPTPKPDQDVEASQPLWSPDGTKVLLRLSEKVGENTKPIGFMVVQVKDMKGRFVTAPGYRYAVWNKDGTGFFANPVSGDRRPDVHILGLSGKQVGSIPKAGWLTDDGFATFSPSGKRFVTYCSTDEAHPQACVYDAATRKLEKTVKVGKPPAAVDTGLLGWFDDDHLIAEAEANGKGTRIDAWDLNGVSTQPIMTKSGPISTWFANAPA